MNAVAADVDIDLEDEDLNAGLKTLLRKLLEAAAAIETIEKDGRNTFHNYQYASAEAYLTRCRKELLARGLLVIGAVTAVEDRTRTTGKGEESAITTARLHMRVYDVETGHSLDIPWAGRGEDAMDKGLSKALTNAIKTFLRQQLLLPLGDDPEADASTDERAAATGGATVNLIAEARGLGNETLNAVLVQAGLPAQQAPFGAFTRIPREAEAKVRDELKAAHATNAR